MSNDYDYDIVLSFAGEDRNWAEDLARQLKEKDIKVFYDVFEQANLWGKDLLDYLADIYQNRGKYCIIFISSNYARKVWTNHERKNALVRAFKERHEYILPLRLDNTQIPGIPETIAYINLQNTPIEKIVKFVEQKLENERNSYIENIDPDLDFVVMEPVPETEARFHDLFETPVSHHTISPTQAKKNNNHNKVQFFENLVDGIINFVGFLIIRFRDINQYFRRWSKKNNIPFSGLVIATIFLFVFLTMIYLVLTSPKTKTIVDAQGNLEGDFSKRYVDITQLSLWEKDGKYYFEFYVDSELPEAKMLNSGDKISFIIFIDLGSYKPYRTKEINADYEIYVQFGQSGWQYYVKKLSGIALTHDLQIDYNTFKTEINQSRQNFKFSFPIEYILSGYFKWWAVTYLTNATQQSPIAKNPPTRKESYLSNSKPLQEQALKILMSKAEILQKGNKTSEAEDVYWLILRDIKMDFKPAKKSLVELLQEKAKFFFEKEIFVDSEDESATSTCNAILSLEQNNTFAKIMLDKIEKHFLDEAELLLNQDKAFTAIQLYEKAFKIKKNTQIQNTIKSIKSYSAILNAVPNKNLQKDVVKYMISKNNFYDRDLNKQGEGFPNKYEILSGGLFVFDYSSGLTWQQSGSSAKVAKSEIESYISQINRLSPDGFSDWRLPTLEEAMSLMEPKRDNYLHIAAIFDKTQSVIWTADIESMNMLSRIENYWTVNFLNGHCLSSQEDCYIRLVR